MRRSFYFLILIIFSSEFVFAEDLSDAVKQRIADVKKATVLIYNHSDGGNVGSGFVTGYRKLPNGDLVMNVMTAGHVVEFFEKSGDQAMIFVGGAGEKTEFGVLANSMKKRSSYSYSDSSKVRNALPQNDTATMRVVITKDFLRRVQSRLPKPVKIRLTPIEPGESVVSFGYPLADDGLLKRKNGKIVDVNNGFISTNFILSAGYSGGPLIDKSGFVVGINTGVWPTLISLHEPALRSPEFGYPLEDISGVRRSELFRRARKFGFGDAPSFWKSLERGLK